MIVRYATAYLPPSLPSSGPSKCSALAVAGKGETIVGEVYQTSNHRR